MLSSADWPQISGQIYLNNMVDIDRKFRTIIAQWGLTDFAGAGIYLGGLQMFYENLMPSTSLRSIDQYDRETSLKQGHDTQAPAQFIAGWYNGIT